MSTPVISVFIVNFNGAAFIAACLESVLASECAVPFEIIVVDNQSTDDSLAVLQGYTDRVTVLKNLHNSGFSKGNNIAATVAQGHYYFLLNNDTVLPKDTLEALYTYMKTQQNIGALVPKLLSKNNTLQCPGSIWGSWRFYAKQPVDVPFIAGAAVFMSREVYESIGGLDENLFFYNDDVDLCKVLLKQKRRLVYYPLTSLTHYGGLSTSFRKLGSLIEGYRGGFYICYKHYPRFYQVYRLVVLLDIIPRLIYHFLCSFFKSEQSKFVDAYKMVLRINWQSDIFVHHPKVKVERL